MSATMNALRNRIKVLSLPGSVPPNPEHDTEGGEVIDTANTEVPINLPGGIVGPQGRDWTGRVKVRHVAMPPAQQPGAGQQEFTLPKEKAWPFPVPPQQHRVGPVTLLTNAGVQFDGASFSFPAQGVVFDNYSNIWLYLANLAIYVPPNCVRQSSPLPNAVTKIIVVAEAPPGIVQPALTANTIFEFTATENEVPYSAGFKFA